jgi:poly-gamma-glutamate synthesis protein (capsule biosynthesis protein)
MPQVNAARCEDGTYDYSATTNYIAPLFRNADIAIINLETTISATGHYSGYPCFASPIAVVDALVDMGVDISLLANNHCCDRLSRGIESTIAELDTRNIAHTGVFRDSADYATNNILRFQVEDIRFALVNYTYGTNGITVPKDRIVNLIDTTAIKQTLRTIPRDSVDCVIACMHWGDEYVSLPPQHIKELSDWLIEQGVDHIIGNHPHVVQPIEIRESKTTPDRNVVAYSTGNLVSNMSLRRTDGGIMIAMKLLKILNYTRPFNVRYLLTWIAPKSDDGKRDFTIYPAATTGTSGWDHAEQKRQQFINDSRSLFNKYNKGDIREMTIDTVRITR